jgi:hypothetical protein
MDESDVEANFNMGLLLMEEEPNPDFNRALNFFLKSVNRDLAQEKSATTQLLKA